MCQRFKSEPHPQLAAGRFSKWLTEFISAMEGKQSSNVPCGDCVACCTSSNFVHIRPTDRDAFKNIPNKIMFPALGLPKGHFLLGYNKKGHCPMFKKGMCSIYEFRPETCRQYDCRIYPATGVSLDDKKSKIAERAKQWKFDITSFDDFEKYEAVQHAASFLLKYRDELSNSYVMRTSTQLAVFAIRVHELFIGQDLSTIKKDANDIVDSILERHST